ncbi:MAG: hypothetical protein HY850_12780 [Betaproteobacteria bacterium]|nr:hypothetical protein [Betaproteobacteria bacterium]
MRNENAMPSAKHVSILRKVCPMCGAGAQAEARLPISAGVRPPEIDLDRPDHVGAQLSVGQLLSLVEVIPYKQFRCQKCGHEFKLASQMGKALLVDMLGSMQPIAPAPKKPAAKAKPAAKKAPAKPAKTAPAKPADDGWEPLSIDPA